jgi:hypothetical protein
LPHLHAITKLKTLNTALCVSDLRTRWVMKQSTRITALRTTPRRPPPIPTLLSPANNRGISLSISSHPRTQRSFLFRLVASMHSPPPSPYSGTLLRHLLGTRMSSLGAGSLLSPTDLIVEVWKRDYSVWVKFFRLRVNTMTDEDG